MVKVLSELPNVMGKFVKNLTSNVAGRNMVFLPLTKRSILQYCSKFLVKILKVTSFICIKGITLKSDQLKFI